MLPLALTLTALANPSEDLPAECNALDPGAYLLTMSPGGSLTNIFGHNALLMTHSSHGPVVYDWGHYLLGDLETAWGLLRGNPEFWLGADRLDYVLKKFERQDRIIIAQQLDLPQAAMDHVAAELDWLSPRDRRAFTYHWLDRNCTTEVLTLLDTALGGELSQQHAAASEQSPASQALRHTSGHVAWLGLHLGCGRVAHGEVSDWRAMFMPSYALDTLASSTVTWPDGDPRPLVSRTCTLLPGSKGFARPRAPNRDAGFALAGLVGAAGLIGLHRVRPGLARLGIAAIGAWLGFWGTVVLLIGLLGMFVPVWEYHNLPFCSPLSALLIVAAAVARRRPRLAGQLASLLLGIAGLGVGIAAVRGFGDHNLGVMAAVLPWLGASWWILHRSTGGDRT